MHRNGDADETFTVEAAGAPEGGAFGPAQVLTRRAVDVERLSLAVAAGGAALLAHDCGAVVRLFECAPGASGFGPARELGTVDARALSAATEPALALRDDGAAVVAWREGEAEPGVRRHAVLPVPRLFGAGAVRRGRSILVRWRTAFPARQVRFFVAPAGKPPTKPGGPPFDFRALGFVEGHGRTRFTLRLRPEHPAAVRRLVVFASDREGGGGRKVTVPVIG